MNEWLPQDVMVEANRSSGPQRRRSPRLASPQAPSENDTKMALGVKRSITVRKIVPRKTAVSSKHNKENTPRRSEHTQEKKPKVSTSDTVPGRRASSLSSAGREKQQQQAAMPSPIVPSSPLRSSRTQLPAADPDPDDSVWSQKVRRSYSRLSDTSVHSPSSRETLFGFERLKTPEVVRKAEQSRTALEVSGSFTSLLEANECCTEPDPNIPGVAVVKERRRRRRRKVQQIDTVDLDALAAKMNAEFREAEEFELVVE